jgi:hypothetical protein
LTPIVFILSGLAVSVEGVYTKLKASSHYVTLQVAALVGAGDVVVRILVAV